MPTFAEKRERKSTTLGYFDCYNDCLGTDSVTRVMTLKYNLEV